jgi:glycogen operon protein
MLLAGDDFGNSQCGNNNAYAQDNETGWIDWTGLDGDPRFFDEVRSLIRLRRAVPLLRQVSYRHGETATATGQADIEWFDASGSEIAPDQWPEIVSLGILLSCPNDAELTAGGELAVAVLFNAHLDDCEFSLPAIAAAGRWTCRFSSAGGERPAPVDRRFRVSGFSVACLTYA